MPYPGVLHPDLLYPGDVTVFPRGMLHFELNVGTEKALYFSALNSQNPGTLVRPVHFQRFDWAHASELLCMYVLRENEDSVWLFWAIFWASSKDTANIYRNRTSSESGKTVIAKRWKHSKVRERRCSLIVRQTMESVMIWSLRA